MKRLLLFLLLLLTLTACKKEKKEIEPQDELVYFSANNPSADFQKIGFKQNEYEKRESEIYSKLKSGNSDSETTLQYLKRDSTMQLYTNTQFFKATDNYFYLLNSDTLIIKYLCIETDTRKIGDHSIYFKSIEYVK